MAADVFRLIYLRSINTTTNWIHSLFTAEMAHKEYGKSETRVTDYGYT